jgi:hypothetical protein
VNTAVRIIISLGAAAVMLAAALDAAGQQGAQSREQVQARVGKREIIPGSELMTSKEREDYRRRYAAAKTEADREKVRADHIKAMQERARLRGLQLALPVPPPAGGK